LPNSGCQGANGLLKMTLKLLPSLLVGFTALIESQPLRLATSFFGLTCCCCVYRKSLYVTGVPSLHGLLLDHDRDRLRLRLDQLGALSQIVDEAEVWLLDHQAAELCQRRPRGPRVVAPFEIAVQARWLLLGAEDDATALLRRLGRCRRARSTSGNEDRGKQSNDADGRQTESIH
jgi:hypothetical protein